jgi:Double zinc ribbon/Sel1 repeat
MTVRCAQCGQENNPQYRFCGMCGAPLGPPPAAVPNDLGRERVRIPVSGPSFLGLGDERSRDLDYLLEDEPPRGHARLYLALLLLVVSGALLAWHWQRDGYPWAGFILKPTVSRSSAPVSSPPVPPPDSAAAAAPVVPVEPTANPAPPEAQPPTGAAAQPPVAEPAVASTSANPSAPVKPADQTMQPNAVPDSGEAAAKLPGAASAPASESDAAEPAPKEMRVSPAVPASKSVSPKPSPAPAVPSPTFEDRMVADGEKYLYGRGVPEDCERARRNLQIGARQSNARAQTLLGAMYATGHCVNRDLPSAYRWFAKALHGDPGNSRVQRDLEVLWKQMTPEERQLAMKSQ